ncbi:LacI family DNA-binding transcriptional regulator [Cohaesibacter sp. ES.047]|uniref:LacI family DNA-binding transcriptional regulator n=1 Tax=Cohaesibacter sp. ES.047 TaxID=1798205 RepID=UPI001FCEE15F|nr:LacI family DNA-binding transcriptional regulator [Cohaesibacter sp. ES.047]
MQSVTMKQVAELSRVSPSTVSLYLRKPEAVSEKAQEKIQNAIDTLGYVPNLIAGGLAAARSNVVSIIVPSLRTAFFSQWVNRVERLLSEHGIQTLIGHSEYSLDREERLVKAALSWKPAGIVLTGVQHTDTVRTMLANSEVPVVETWDIDGEPIDTSVGFNHKEVGQKQCQQLIDRGCKNIVFVGARLQEDSRARMRCLGSSEAAIAAGIAFTHVSDLQPASTKVGVRALNKIVSSFKDVDGIVCSSDIIALGLLFECQRLAIKVPEDMAIVGFGDLDFAETCNPGLTSIKLNFDKMAAIVTERLISSHSGLLKADLDTPVVDIGFELVQRDSA